MNSEHVPKNLKPAKKMLPILVLLALPVILILYFQKHKTKPAKTLHPPGPPRLPFIGNLHQFDGQYPHLYLYRLSKQYGPLVSLKLGFRPVLVISSADVVREIMKSHDADFSGRPVLVSLQRLSYNGLDVAFSPYNEMWKETRKICNIHLFSLKQVQYFSPIYKDEASKMIKKIARDASLARITNLSETIVSFTSNTICRVAFGRCYGDEGYGRNPFFDLLHETQAMMGGFFVEDYLPSLGWIDKLTGMAARLEKNFRDLDSFYQELIEEHLDSNRPKPIQGDILDILLGLKRNGSSSIDLTLDQIKAILMNIITGGTDTSSAVLVWALTALIKNPLIMKKAQAEIRQLAGKKDLIDGDDIAGLPYLRAVIKETLRLYPPAPLLAPRETIQKLTINGYDIQPGTLVYFHAWAIARDPEIWKNPDEFFPERFLESDVDVRGRDPELIPFGIGRRGCPGMSTGLATMELALANLLYKFDWEVPPGMKPEDVDFDGLPGMTIHKKNALCLVAK
ncbi:hypothetical protein Pfo_020693, partial [Paulownia fortunei]